MSEIQFAHFPPTAAEHFKLYFYAAVLKVLDHVTRLFDSQEAIFKEFPFLAGYQDQLAGIGLVGKSIGEARQCWRDAVSKWEKTVQVHLPLRALAETTGLDQDALTLLITVGLIEEDSRFGLLFDALQGEMGQRRPTLGLLSNWHDQEEDNARVTLRSLHRLGLIHIINPELPRLEEAVAVPAPIWDVIRGERYEVITPWARYRPPEQLLAYEELIVSADVQNTLQTLPPLLVSRAVDAVIVRGPQHNGRHTLLGVLARMLARGVLEVDLTRQAEAERWRLIGLLSTLLHALPVMKFDLLPGESMEVPALAGCDGPLGMVLSKTGGLIGAGVERAITITVELPTPDLRSQHWQGAIQPHQSDDLEILGKSTALDQRKHLSRREIGSCTDLVGSP